MSVVYRTGGSWRSGDAGAGRWPAVPVVGAWDAFNVRTVLRDLIEPPLDVRDLTPLASFRHYTTGLKTTTLVSLLPCRGARCGWA